ncbi:MAG: hypothetical protein KF723_06935 [Rhizobiaceae bacterium]|nr:hypothetical protein [Rhizobiaceae bacterium]
MIELTDRENRFLKRVSAISFMPWTGKVTAVDAKGKSMRISKATFHRLKDENIIIRSESALTSDTYIVNPVPVVPALEMIG